MEPSLYKAIEDYWEDHGDLYDNPNDVQIVYICQDEISVDAIWPGMEDDPVISLEVSFTCQKITDLVDAFNLKTVEDIDKITPDALFGLYQSGKGLIYCALDENLLYHLYFRKQGNILMAREEEEDAEHEVYEILETPDQFINYTRFYFKTFRNLKV